MLANQINKIRNSTTEYLTHLWDFRFSGDTLELSVKPNFSNASEEYRIGVIAIGKVIYAIENFSRLNGYHMQSHSFPNLYESQLVASIRLHKNYENTGYYQESNDNVQRSTEPLPKLLKAIASHYGFCFNILHKELLEGVYVNDAIPGDENEIYSLCGTMDNPFVWLKTGQWLERIKLFLDQNDCIEKPVISTSLEGRKRAALASYYENCTYCQAVIVVKKTVNLKKVQPI